MLNKLKSKPLRYHMPVLVCLAAIVILLLSFAGLRLDMSQFAVPM